MQRLLVIGLVWHGKMVMWHSFGDTGDACLGWLGRRLAPVGWQAGLKRRKQVWQLVVWLDGSFVREAKEASKEGSKQGRKNENVKKSRV